MKVKYLLALALSHRAELLILDEPTSGLDPVSRDELLDIFRQLVNNGSCSILFSTHITLIWTGARTILPIFKTAECLKAPKRASS